MFIATSLSWYKRPEVQQQLVDHAQDKEVTPRFSQSMGKRPDVLAYPNDVLELAKKGASSFHASEELWHNPLALKPGMKREELDALRKGWDLLIDVDCTLFAYSKLATHYIIKTLHHYGINSITVKFSGNKGFHIAVPFEAFPAKVGAQPLHRLFPEAPKRIALLIKESIKQPVMDALLKLEKNDLDNIANKIGDASVVHYQTDREGNKIKMLNIEAFLAIDTLLISSRHMYRMPYSLHEKSGLVSVPLDPNKVLSFQKVQAHPDSVTFSFPFLDRTKVAPNEGATLLREAYDFSPQLEEEEEQRVFTSFLDDNLEMIPETYFPPTIKKLLEGVEDGRKRGVFILIAFLSHMGWDYPLIEKRIHDWNQKNAEPLKEVYLKGQLRHYKAKRNNIMPPSYDNKAYYQDLQIYCGEKEKDNVKNPVQWVRKRLGFIKRDLSKQARAQKTKKKNEGKKSRNSS